MSSALKRGRTLNPEAVEKAKHWRDNRINYLDGRKRLKPKELRELRRLKS